jgi:hypothetical protein
MTSNTIHTDLVDKFLPIESRLGVSVENFHRKFIFNYLKESFLKSDACVIMKDDNENIYVPIDTPTPS